MINLYNSWICVVFILNFVICTYCNEIIIFSISTDPSDEVDLWALHLVYLPRINAALQDFLGQWNYHGLSTEHGMNPRELFMSGMVERIGTNLTAVRDVFDRDGVPAAETSDGTNIIPANIEEILGRTRVEVPSLDCPLTQEQVEFIQGQLNAIPPLGVEDFGITHYLTARSMARELLQ